ncbi:OmpA family protein [Amantichitinum ursilacus]|uniref:OmpA-like domain-containing protein n=1 Tax=Amantichitinum ursilacus TaxID=857265 RepID=A0A0N0GLX5_9NEIS|nr:OmpA family protein [Amantichitinum ursilacus]KPC50387.1 hypothetical protein WG78_17305 [Amantichitinum ursilacus]
MRAGIFFVAVAFLAGCATDTPPAAPAAPREHWLKDASAVAAAAKPGAQTASGPVAASAISGDPMRIEFDPMGATLDANGKAKIAALISTAQTAKYVNVRGFCDRTKIGNAKAAALARANVVKKEFVAAGIPAAKVRVRFTTDKPESAALISFE